MSEPMSLMEFLLELLGDVEVRDGFLADPHATLAGHGLVELSPADVHDALVLVEDTRTADFGPAGLDVGVTVPFARPPAPVDGDHADAVQYLSGYLTGSPGGGFGDGGDVDADLGRHPDQDLDSGPDPAGHDWDGADRFDDGAVSADPAGFGSGAADAHHDVDALSAVPDGVSDPDRFDDHLFEGGDEWGDDGYTGPDDDRPGALDALDDLGTEAPGDAAHRPPSHQHDADL